MARWIQEGYWGRYLLRLRDDGTLFFYVPRAGGGWRVTEVDLSPADDGAFGLTSFKWYEVASTPTLQPSGSGGSGGSGGGAAPAPGQPGYVRPGAPPNARLVDILRSVNDGAPTRPAPSPSRRPPPNDDEP